MEKTFEAILKFKDAGHHELARGIFSVLSTRVPDGNYRAQFFHWYDAEYLYSRGVSEAESDTKVSELKQYFNINL